MFTVAQRVSAVDNRSISVSFRRNFARRNCLTGPACLHSSLVLRKTVEMVVTRELEGLQASRVSENGNNVLPTYIPTFLPSYIRT